MAYQLDGSTQRLRVASPIVTSYPFTLSAWIKTASTVPSCTVLGPTALSGGSYYTLGISAGLKPQVGGAFAAAGTSNLATNTFYNLTGVFTSTFYAIYLNGGLQTSTAGSSTFYSGMTRFGIGCLDRTTAGSFFNGIVLEAAVWNAELSSAEIASLGAAFTAEQVRPQSLQFYAPLVRDLIDARSGLAITNVNGATVADHPRIIT